MLYTRLRKENTLKQHGYRIGQFARLASVTERTLRFYDKMGLLSPSQHTEAGYRLYAEADLLTLQQILALKFLGLSLEEIKLCLQQGPKPFREVLTRQRRMMLEKRSQLDAIVKALEETEAQLQAGRCDWQTITRVIQVIQMEQTTEWVKKYFTEEQLQKMQELGQASYSEEASQKLQQRGPWTEEDQKRAEAQWRFVATEARRLAAAGADPAGEEAQAVAKIKSDLLRAFTQGSAEIEAGVATFWQNYRALPKQERPFDSSPYDAGEAGNLLLESAMTIYKERQ